MKAIKKWLKQINEATQDRIVSEDTVKILNSLSKLRQYNEVYRRCSDNKIINNALNKEIPIRLTYGRDNWTDKPRCGACDKLTRTNETYCHSCGHKILWGRDAINNGKYDMERCNKCGGEPEVIGFWFKGTANRRHYFVKCKECGNRPEKYGRSFVKEDKAVECWNMSMEDYYRGE